MKRKILAVVLTLAMVVCYMPTMAFAGSHIIGEDEQPSDSWQASITDGGVTTYYDTFKDAIAAANSNSDYQTMIKLLKSNVIAFVNCNNPCDHVAQTEVNISDTSTPELENVCFTSYSDAWKYAGTDNVEFRLNTVYAVANPSGTADYEASLSFAVSSTSNATFYFKTVEDAFKAAEEFEGSETITLLKSAEVESQLLIQEGETVTLNLNGKTLTSKLGTGYLFDVNGSLTVKGTISGSKMTYASIGTSESPAFGSLSFDVSGNLRIESGEFETKSNSFISTGGPDAEVILTGGTISYNGGSSDVKGINAQSGKIIIGENGKTSGPTIKGYTIEGSTPNTAVYAKGEGTTVEVYGGTFTGNDIGLWAADKSVVTVYGGDFTVNSLAAKATAEAKLYIKGGTCASSGGEDFEKDQGSTIQIYAGTFKYEPKSSWIALYYGTKKINDTKYIVCDKVEITVTMADKIYDGAMAVPVVSVSFMNPTKYISQTSITDAEFNYTWSKKNSEGIINQPSEVGEYTVVVAISNNDQKYILESPVSKDFKITSQKLFLVAEDKTVKVGDAAPTFTFKSSLQSDGTAFTTTETTYSTFITSLTNSNIELKDSSGNAVTLDNALKTVGEYKIYVKATVPTNVDANYDITLNKVYDADATDKQKDYCGTLTVEPKTAATYGFSLGESKSEDNVVALADDVITEDTIEALVAKNTGSKGVSLILDATLVDPDAEAIQIPVSQAKVLYDYMNATSTKDKVTGLTFIFADGTINLDGTALNNIYSGSGTTADYIEISAKAIDTTGIKADNNLKTALEDVDGVIKVLDLKVKSMKKADAVASDTTSTTTAADTVVKSFTDFGSGKATVTTSLKTADNKKGTDYSVYHINMTDAELTDMKATFTKATPVSTSDNTGVKAYEEGTLSFTASKIAYYVVCETIGDETCDGKASCPCYSFLDLDIYTNPSVWYHEYIDYVVENEMMNGTGTNTFEPTATVTRAMVVTMLYRLAGSPENLKLTPFIDIDATQWYGPAVKWAYNNDIVKGLDETHFGPDQAVTREQLATILYRYYTEYLNKTATLATTAEMNKFADIAKVSAYAENAMKWAVKAGIIGGEQSGSSLNLKPGDGTLRQEIAKMFTVFDRDILKTMSS